MRIPANAARAAVAACLLIVAAAPSGHAAACSWPYWAYYSGPDMCWYYGEATTVAGPTDCKLPGSQKSEATASCKGNKPRKNACSLSREKSTQVRYKLTGSLTADAFGLGAEFETETKEVVECKLTIEISVNCEYDKEPDQTCCKEAYEVQRTITKKRDVISCVGSDGDTGECNSNPPQSCQRNKKQCTEQGTLIELLSSNCSDCTTLKECL